MTTPPSYAWRHRYAIGIVLGVLGALVVFQAVDSTGDDYDCSDGTTHDYKIDGLGDIDTFVVPDPTPGSTIVAVVIKAGPDHHTYQPVAPGDVLAVKADVGHGASHAHICETEDPPSTTDPGTTSTSTTAVSAPSSSTAPPTTAAATTSSTLAPTTTAPASTSTSSPPNSSPNATTTSSTPPSTTSDTTPTTGVTASTNPSTTASVPPSTVGPTLPATGPSEVTLLVSGFGTLFVLAGLVLLVMIARRPQ